MENVELSNVSIDLLTQFGYQIIAAALIFFIGRWLAKRLVNFAKKIMAKAEIEDILE